MDNETRITGMVESLLFVAGEDGLTGRQLAEATETDLEAVGRAIAILKKDYDGSDGRGIMLTEVAGTFRLVTKPEHAEAVRRLLENPTAQSLTQASLEVLAIIAYRQPITRVEIEEIRGVKSERPLQTLVTRGMVRETGRAEGTGRAILYGTTDAFLDHFGLASIEDLPKLADPEGEEGEEELDLFMSSFTETFADESAD
ncbi:SMC-Scp complex subunit ScpB [Bhargavaea ullalensis]|uniref:Segregation and condensation protein B n=1 Tax=Bhargavaea ullalensis TaxID=1265685 RepID=A0ABV2GDU2_9BACL